MLGELLAGCGLESEFRLTLLWRALEAEVEERLRDGPIELRPAVEAAFQELINHCSEDDTENQSTQLSLATAVDALLEGIEGRQGHFASFLYGDTTPQTQRNLQYAFNRKKSWPKVLVAQSRMASEGLNLQSACRSIVMFHPEWNPATCEQQIGRVDRLGSLWREMATSYFDEPGGNEIPPRIEILIPYIEGTYAEHNLRVLETRWGRLRAQLHGDILALDQHQRDDVDIANLADRIQSLTPRFHP